MVNKISNMLLVRGVALDKQKHFVVGFFLPFLGFLYSPLIFSGLIAGVAKEIYDYYRPEKHTAELNDMFYTWIGSFFGIVICYAFVWVYECL